VVWEILVATDGPILHIREISSVNLCGISPGNEVSSNDVIRIFRSHILATISCANTLSFGADGLEIAVACRSDTRS
jgi:hypothetical protein